MKVTGSRSAAVVLFAIALSFTLGQMRLFSRSEVNFR